MATNNIVKNVIAKRLMSTSGQTTRYISPVSALSQISHKVSPFEQRLLVWSGQFKKITDVPSLVSRDTMEKARNHYRIRVNLIIAGLTVLGSFAMVISGKNAAHRGENINDYNAEWHRKYNEAHKYDH
ncbi:hypothetical protein GHT06_011971 [Daphnia sinensis]|uniref:Uncharacterized protein n=1 Tax=Daphnia sinensis TaxID=1820382 RepID=A0AAD5PZF7_9CRUS|nr:hypothetical protein GHT06_011971 [Daphnia sinensis]